MQKNFLTALSLLTFAAAGLTGCGSTEGHPNGFIDKTGAIVVDLNKVNPKPIAVGDYSEGEGLVPVKFASGSGCLDKNGAIVFNKPYRHISSYSEGKAAFSTGTSDADERWGYIDKKGNVVIKPVYLAANKFSEGVAAVKLEPGKGHKESGGDWCYIDENGKQTVKLTFDQAEPFSEGLAAVSLKGRMGTINRQGLFIVPAQYDVVYPANDGNIVASQGNGLSGPSPGQELDYYDKNGAKVVHKSIKPITLANLRPKMWALIPKKADKGKTEEQIPDRPLSGCASPGYSESKSMSQAGLKFTVDQQFNARAFKGAYDYIFPVSGGFCVVYNDAEGGKMDYRGGVPGDSSGIWNSTAFRFWDCAPFSDGLGLVQETKGGPYGYIDKTGNYVIRPTFDHARPFHDDRALVGEMVLHPF
jgi:hypothetical protein